MSKKLSHAEGNARGWSKTIKAMVAALKADEYPVTVEGEEYEDADSLIQRIQESPLSVQVRSGWVNVGQKMEAEEFELLLSTGGPALRIVGELDEHKQPFRAWLEYQDWGTPWIEFRGWTPGETLIDFCAQFYFGE